MYVKWLFVCDQKPGACDSWGKGWKHCENESCFHTSNVAHALNGPNTAGNGKKYIKIIDGDRCMMWEYTCKCEHPEMKCTAQLLHAGKKLCIDGKCPL